MSPSGLLVRTGSVGISFLIWLACGLLSLLGESFINIDWKNFRFFSLHQINRSEIWIFRFSSGKRSSHQKRGVMNLSLDVVTRKKTSEKLKYFTFPWLTCKSKSVFDSLLISITRRMYFPTRKNSIHRLIVYVSFCTNLIIYDQESNKEQKEWEISNGSNDAKKASKWNNTVSNPITNPVNHTVTWWWDERKIFLFTLDAKNKIRRRQEISYSIFISIVVWYFLVRW